MSTPASSSPTAQPSPGPAPARRGWGAVSIVLVGAFMALLDVTIVNVALPTIRSGLHASPASLEWIVSGYALAYGLALVPGGRAGDRFGAKRLFLTGLTIFTLASVGCGIAQGYFFSRPLSTRAVEEILVANCPLGPKKAQPAGPVATTGNEPEVYYPSTPIEWPKELHPA